MVRTREQLCLSEEQAQTPIHVGKEMWTILEAARYIYNAHRSDDRDPQKVALLMVEFDRLREEARDMEDQELVGAADALEKSARDILLNCLSDSESDAVFGHYFPQKRLRFPLGFPLSELSETSEIGSRGSQ